jgi:23S rRNA (pseudouridine1915-N3)-methyltransferase
MEIIIIAAGKCKDKAILELVAHYQKRLKPFFKNRLIEVPQSQASRADDIKAEEAKIFNEKLKKIPEKSFIIALDERGESPSTLKLAQIMKTKQETGAFNQFCIIIGGAEGLHEDIRNRANYVLSLSKLTYPHMMVRPIILEQLYRVASVNAGHPYHRQ